MGEKVVIELDVEEIKRKALDSWTFKDAVDRANRSVVEKVVDEVIATKKDEIMQKVLDPQNIDAIHKIASLELNKKILELLQVAKNQHY